jgi:hypothetical protein
MQLRFCAVRAFKLNVRRLAVEGEGPFLRFAMPQDSSLHLESVVVEPAPFDRIDAIARRRFSEEPVKADGPSVPGGGPVQPFL